MAALQNLESTQHFLRFCALPLHKKSFAILTHYFPIRTLVGSAGFEPAVLKAPGLQPGRDSSFPINPVFVLVVFLSAAHKKTARDSVWGGRDRALQMRLNRPNLDLPRARNQPR